MPLRTKNLCFHVLYFSPFFLIHPELSGLPSLSIKLPSRIASTFSRSISLPAGSTTLTLIDVGASRPDELSVDSEGFDFIDSIPAERSEPLLFGPPNAPKSLVERFARSWSVERDRGIGAATLPSESSRSAEGTRGGGLRLRPIKPPTAPTLPRNVEPRSLLLVFILDAAEDPFAGFGLDGTVVDTLPLPTSLLDVLERFIFGFDKSDAAFEPPPPPLAVERGRLASVVSPPSVAAVADSSTTDGRASLSEEASSCVSVVIERFLSAEGTIVVVAISAGTDRAERKLPTDLWPS